MQKYSVFSLIKNAFSNHMNWDVAWKDPTPKKETQTQKKISKRTKETETHKRDLKAQKRPQLRMRLGARSCVQAWKGHETLLRKWISTATRATRIRLLRISRSMQRAHFVAHLGNQTNELRPPVT